MDAHRCASVAFLAVGLAASGCGDHEPAKTTAPPPPAKPAAAPAEASSVSVGCIAKWTAGATATLQCRTSGPDKDKVKLDKDTFRLDSICVNDARIATFGFGGGQTAPIGAKGDTLCASFNGQSGRLPESCTCVPPPGGDCTPPRDGFICLAAGHVPLGGG
jgi:hypothetical protein